ncbi:MAG: aldo/keto reductase [Candidatus Brocadiaceae bacterium]|nr:aldo/keto reductase [Candidatus Brocadiaceae bacterium]
MKRVILGKTGLETSYIGLGTSAAYEGIVCPAKLKVDDYPELLCFAYEHGVTLWDTSLTYGTHKAIREALRRVRRKDVVICSKTAEVTARKVRPSVETALKEIGTDYIDIFLLQCVRNGFDLWYRSGVLEALLKMKEEGYIRAVGIASHGLGALEKSRALDLDIILGRINCSGHSMDSRQDGLKSIFAGMPAIKKISGALLPDALFKKAAASVQPNIASETDRETALKLFQELHGLGKSIIGMKILGEGNLSDDIPSAVSYVTSLPFIDAVVVGCCSKKELLEIIEAVDSAVSYT